MAPTSRPYIERVMTSMHTLQAEKKKHSIHLTSLRAHIKKTAMANGEKLGPQSAKWISNAVEKLVGEGMLTYTDPNMIAFTPVAKKTITAARRSIVPPAPGTPVQPERVAKEVMKQRTKRKSAIFHDEEYTPRAKRARRSSRGPGRVTKAELQSQLEHLQKKYDALATLRSTSPLTELGDEDGLELDNHRDHEVELHETHQQIQRLQTELNILRDQPDDLTQNNDDAPTDIEMDAPSSPFPQSSPTTMFNGTPSARPIVRARLSGIIRTQSGTLIPEHSRQPTPPGSPGTHYDSDPMQDDVPPMDLFGASGPRVDTTSAREAVLVEELASATQAGALMSTQLEELRTLKAAVDKSLLVSQAKEQTLAGQADELRRQVSGEETTVATLHGELKAAQLENHNLRGQLDTMATENAEFKNLVGARELDLVNASAKLTEANGAIAGHLQAITIAQAQISETSLALSSTRANLDNKCAEVDALLRATQDKESELSSLTLTLHGAREELDVLRSDIASRDKFHQAEVEESARTISELQHNIAELDESRTSVRDDNVELSMRLDEAKQELDALREDNASKETAHEATKAQSDIRISELQRDNEQMTRSYAMVRDENADLASRLSETDGSIMTLRTELASKDLRISSLEQSLASERARVAGLKDEMERSIARAVTAEELVSSLTTSKAEDAATIAGLKASFETLRASQLQALSLAESQILSASSAV